MVNTKFIFQEDIYCHVATAWQGASSDNTDDMVTYRLWAYNSEKKLISNSKSASEIQMGIEFVTEG